MSHELAGMERRWVIQRLHYININHLHIVREEVRNQVTNRYEVVEHTKSTHKMRKTFASNLNASGVPLDCIRELLGHSNLNTTLGYIYNPLTEKETYDLISKAL